MRPDNHFIPISGPGDRGVVMWNNYVTLPASGHTIGIAPFSWIDSDGVAVATGAAAAAFVVYELFSNDGKRLDFQGLTATELNAATHLARVAPIGGIVFEGKEDALVTPITDANASGVYAEFNQSTPTDTSTTNSPVGGATAVQTIDSDSVNAAQSGLLLQLLGLAPRLDQPAYSATAGASPRYFRLKVADAAATYSQS